MTGREYAKTNFAIWQDPDWRALPVLAQHFYKMLWEHPQISWCGVLDWRPLKMIGWGVGWTPELVRAVTDCLRARHFIVVDEETEEILIRSWIRFDGLMRQPKLAVSMTKAFVDVGSNDLRGVIVNELNKLKEIEPGAKGWGQIPVEEILALPRVNAKDLAVPDDPFVSDFDITLQRVSGSVSASVSNPFGLNAGHGLGSVSNPPTTATATATFQHLNGDGSSSALAESSDTTPAEESALADGEGNRFDEFWDTYGKKVDRKGSAAKWKLALKKRGVTADLLIAAAREYVTWERENNEAGRFIMDPSKWLNGERWNDERAARSDDGTKGSGYTPQYPHASEFEPAPSGMTQEEAVAWAYEQAAKRRQARGGGGA